MATFISSQSIDIAAKHIRNGGLVAFPTETVYGLGADCLQPDSVKSIFEAKDRPFNDPLICHVLDEKQALTLLDITPDIKHIFDSLITFWPGPLTIVAKALEHVPKITMANGNTVGVRCPQHPIARELIRLSGCAIAAPSANRFGHVSPTSSQHVMDDLSHVKDLLILTSEHGVDVGIESTVVRIVDHNNVDVLRLGGISINEIKDVLKDVNVNHKVQVKNINRSCNAEPEVAPGQLLRHYAPDVPAYTFMNTLTNNSGLENVVVIDFKESNVSIKEHCLKYFNLGNNAKEASNTLFDILRAAENVLGAVKILIADVRGMSDEVNGITTDALYDRIFRATEGKSYENKWGV